MVPPFMHVFQVFHFLQVWPRSSGVKVKVILEQTIKSQMDRRSIALLFLYPVLDVVGDQRHTSAALALGEKPGTRFVRG